MKLNEIMVMPGEQLSQAQQSVLLKIYMAVSPAAATEVMKGDDHALAAGEYLLKTGKIATMGGGVKITPAGMQELSNSGLVDSFKLTQKGQQMVNQSSAPST